MYDLEDLKARTNIIDLARDLGLEPKQSGTSNFARCPSHDDKGRPNLSLHERKGAICFRCGYKADVIKLAADVRFNGNKGEAIKYLATRAGMVDKNHPSSTRKATTPETLPKGAPLPSGPIPTPAAKISPEEATWETIKVTTPKGISPLAWGEEGKSFWRRLSDGRIEATYDLKTLKKAFEIADYKITPDQVAGLTIDEIAWVLSTILNCEATVETIKTASPPRKTNRVEIYEALLSYCDQTFATAANLWLLQHKGIEIPTQIDFMIAWLKWEEAAKELPQIFGVEALHALGLMKKNKETGEPTELRFKKHRLLFPFFLTTNGRRYPVYIQGRDIAAIDKHFRFDNPSGPVPCPYNFDAVMKARKDGKPVLICEGATDTLTLAQAGFHAVGIVGTQGFKPDWVKHFDGVEVFLATDPDEPGQEAARKIAGVFYAQGRPSPKIIPLPQGQDITDYFTGNMSKNPVNG